MTYFNFSITTLFSFIFVSFYFYSILLFTDVALINSGFSPFKRIIISLFNGILVTFLLSIKMILPTPLQFLVLFFILNANIILFYKTYFIAKFFFISAYFIHAMCLRSIVTAIYSYASGLTFYDVAHNSHTLHITYIIVFALGATAIICVRYLIPATEIRVINQNKLQLYFMVLWINLFNIYLLFNSQIFDLKVTSNLHVFLEILSPIIILLGLYIVLFFVIQMGKLLGYKEKLQIQIVESEKQFNEMRIKAERDPLTQLYNKELTSVLIENHINGSAKFNHSALLLIDIDSFKDANDQKGHKFGDEVLVELARTLKEIFRVDDIVGRVGGDEFMVYMKNIKNDSVATSKANSVCKQFCQIYKSKHGVEKQLSVSIGIAAYPADGLTMNELYLKADEALYKVKSEGKNGFQMYKK